MKHIKKYLFIFILTLLLVCHMSVQAAEDLQEAYRLYQNKQFKETLALIDQLMLKKDFPPELIQLKFIVLMQEKKYDEALTFVDSQMARTGKSDELLGAKQNVLVAQGKLDAALEVALEKDKLATTKNPWESINIMNLYVQLRRPDDALDALQEAVSRGFISYRTLSGKEYELLVKNTRFYEIIETIKSVIGLGNPARNFKVNLMSGQELGLSSLKGRVVIVYFWATWCSPCMNQMPFLLKLYNEYKDKNLEIIAISLDQDADRVKTLIEKHKLEWNMVCSGKAWDDPTAKDYNINSLPSLWLIDKKGILRSYDIQGDELRQAIALLISERN